jgi:GDP-L-fucose synthase
MTLASSADILPSMTFQLFGKRVFVTGHRGMVGSALVRRLAREGCDILIADRNELDLRRPAEVLAWMQAARPDAVFLVAAHQGGILLHRDRPAEILFDNLMIEASVIEAARACGVSKLVFTASAAAYPEAAPQPFREDDLLSGPFEAGHQYYATAKIAGWKLCQAYRIQYGCDFITALPGNLYGPGAKFGAESTNVVPGLIERFHTAKAAHAGEVVVWGTGEARRELLYVDDCADALVCLMKGWNGSEPVNLGSGGDISIRALAEAVARVVGFGGELVFDRSRPDGAARRLMDGSRLESLGWRPSVDLESGLARTYDWYLQRLTAS